MSGTLTAREMEEARADFEALLVDDEDDTLVRELPVNVVAAVRVLLEYAEQLTDGEAEPPPQETPG